MDEAERLPRDRRLYHLHAITVMVGLGGVSVTGALHRAIDADAAPWVLMFFANAVAPYALLFVGLAFVAFWTWWVLR
jgi:hypothetical protein